MITEWKYTPTGKKSTARDNLIAGVKDPELLELLLYTSAMQTCIGTFMLPWLEKSQYDGRLHPNWNQIRTHDGRSAGTRTGRLSSDDPNFQNVPNPYAIQPPPGLTHLPQLKNYLLPEEGCMWVSRDFSSQEMRLLAHFEQGVLCSAFNENPDMDPHEMVRLLIKENTGRDLPRKYVKNIGFGLIYGMGIGAITNSLGVSKSDAMAMVYAYHQALPGVAILQKLTKKRGRSGIPITTWGGRRYLAETARDVQVKPGIMEWRSFEYKLLNYLIQGSAADQTKECIIHWEDSKPADQTLLCTVHDELNISVPLEHECDGLRRSMEYGEFLVPMRSDYKTGTTWGSIAA
jgi:DNA polymerase-1